MRMNAEVAGQSLIVTVDEPRIDAAVAVRFKDRMRELTDGAGKRVILDLQAVEFLDSSGLGAVVGSMKQLSAGQRLDLAGLSPAVDKVFRMTRMDSVFRIYPDLNLALQDVAHAS